MQFSWDTSLFCWSLMFLCHLACLLVFWNRYPHLSSIDFLLLVLQYLTGSWAMCLEGSQCQKVNTEFPKALISFLLLR